MWVFTTSSVALLVGAASAKNVKTTTPLMGWNSYNGYNCYPSEKIIKDNAQGLIKLGLDKLGYKYITPDCGWNANYRDSAGQLVWNASTFPSGGKALGDFIHGLGLKFGVYSGAGYYQCGSKDQPASLGRETTDAQSFASWGADSLKYDNCYSVSKTTMVDYESEGATSPSRFQTMANVLASLSRDIVYQVCQWGVGTNVAANYKPIANSWRISNDISNNWASIWRITNQVVPYYRYTSTGAYPDMDMLIVGLKVLSAEEERFHFGMWAINKSPLVLGCPLSSSTPSTSLAIMGNTEIIAINQDSLAQQARLVRRYTEEQWDIWAGNLSNSRIVIGLANWKDSSQTVSVDLAKALGISSAAARDAWAAKDIGSVSGTYTTALAGHQLQILVLSNIKTSSPVLGSAAYYSGTDATIAGGATKTTCSSTQCLPVHSKVGSIGQGSSVTFSAVKAASVGTKTLGIDFINYDVALQSAWSGGTNTRNMTISVNGGAAKRWAFPISGGDWFETGRLNIEVGGFKAGDNTVVFRAVGSNWAPDFVGFEVFEDVKIQ